jgi:tetratricopeptide (TPR) repeat protein
MRNLKIGMGGVWLITLALLAGCAMREVRFTVTEAGRVQLPEVQRIAILDFSGPYSNRGLGEQYAQDLAEAFQAKSTYTIILPAAARRPIANMRVLPSQFDSAAVVRDVGKQLGADAILFGDVQTAEIQRSVQRGTFNRKAGERRETVKETYPDGKLHAVVYTYPVYQEFWRDHIRRTLNFHSEARLVRTRDGFILWQDAIDWNRESTAEEEQSGARKGDWTSDEAFLAKHMRSAAEHLLANLLPRVLTRVRILADSSEEGPFAEWMRMGNKAAVSGQWDEAGSFWLKAASLNNGHPGVRANLGILREHNGDFKQALLDYEYAAKQLGKPWNEYARQVKQVLEQK